MKQKKKKISFKNLGAAFGKNLQESNPKSATKSAPKKQPKPDQNQNPIKKQKKPDQNQPTAPKINPSDTILESGFCKAMKCSYYAQQKEIGKGSGVVVWCQRKTKREEKFEWCFKRIKPEYLVKQCPRYKQFSNRA